MLIYKFKFVEETVMYGINMIHNNNQDSQTGNHYHNELQGASPSLVSLGTSDNVSSDYIID